MESGNGFTKSLFHLYQLKLKNILGVIEVFANRINPEVNNLKDKFSKLFQGMPKIDKENFKIEKKREKSSKL